MDDSSFVNALRPSAVLRAVAVLLLFAVVATGRQEDEPDEPGATELTPINAMCPVMPDEPVDPEFTVLYEDQAIGLCCSTCRRKFLRDPHKYLALLPGFEPAPAPQPDEASPELATGEVATSEASPPLDEDESPPSWVRVAGRFHPLVVHFPIALLLAGALAELVDSLRGRTQLRSSMRYCLGLGALGGVVAALLGLAAGAGASFPAELSQSFVRHRATGIATAVLGVLVFLLALSVPREPLRSRRRTALRWALFACALVLGAAGYYGGELVFGRDHLSS